jgi:hypothetical protein
MRRILRSPDAPATSATQPAADPPPAAQVVATGKRTEREVELEKEVEKERETRKQREIRLAELEDENFRLKRAGLTPAPAAPRKNPWTFFEVQSD